MVACRSGAAALDDERSAVRTTSGSTRSVVGHTNGSFYAEMIHPFGVLCSPPPLNRACLLDLWLCRLTAAALLSDWLRSPLLLLYSLSVSSCSGAPSRSKDRSSVCSGPSRVLLSGPQASPAGAQLNSWAFLGLDPERCSVGPPSTNKEAERRLSLEDFPAFLRAHDAGVSNGRAELRMGSVVSFFGRLCGGEKKKEEERLLRANDRGFNLSQQYAKNAIKSSKYNLFTFLPLNLFEQFSRLANAYFLFLLILQLIPQISAVPWFTTAAPLLIVLTVSGVKDANDDINRHKQDKQVNNRMVKVLVDGELREEKWMNIKVGDIVKQESNQFVTADLLLLSSSEPLSLIYVETAELDGETNLKVKQALTVTGEMGDNIDALSAFKGEIQCEPPNNHLDKFKGTLTVDGQQYGLDNDKILLRGCTVRNTEWCFGLVIFAGPDTKLMQNSGRTTFKRTSIDQLMNILVLCIFGFLATICAIMTVAHVIWEVNEGSVFTAFLPRQSGVNIPLSSFYTFWSYVIVLNTVVPISLYVSVEMIRLGNSFFIDWDRKMYYPKKDTPAQARTTTLNEELGQIKYIFSDKTGTLTQNIMTFNKCSINGKNYGELYDFSGQRIEITEKTERVDFSWNKLADPKFVFHDYSLSETVKQGNPKAQAFFRLLALCHTVMPEEKKEGELNYQAQSPDEGALVTAARNFGFVFRSRTPETITVMEMGKKVMYELLAILDFNNVRKRMSVIVRDPEGKMTLYCKGADTIIYDRLHPSCSKLKEVTTRHLNEYAGEGLRTLALAYKDLEESNMERWLERHHEVSTAMEGREDGLDALYEEIETDLMLLGATAVEDKLQDGVPQTIEQLAKADIKIWVLTGDKQETAENIGYSCNMLKEEMKEIFVVAANTVDRVKEELQNARRKMCPGSAEKSKVIKARAGLFWLQKTQTVQDEKVDGEYGLIINGHSLAYALQKDLELDLLRTACMCKTVICCRVTPLQKAQVVELVKKYKQSVTLAIGDGANDVSMIKAAHIGVGISGQEGMQAVLSSDFSFAQFRYLQRLLLVHGRWSYIRMCKFLRYFFYKNFTYTLVHVWYAFFCGFSAQTVYDEWFITMYNMVYTAAPVLALGLFEQDVSDRWSFRYPQLYSPGQLNKFFNKKTFVRCVMTSCCTSLVLFFIPWAAMYDTVRNDGKDIANYQSFALLTQTSLLIVVSAQMFLDTDYWTAMNHFFVWGSVAVYIAITFTFFSNGIFFMFTSSFPFIGTARNSLSQPNVWLTLFLTCLLCVLPVVAYRFLLTQLRPTITDKVRYKAREEGQPAPAPYRPPPRRISTRRSSYAFSHSQGFGDLVTSRRFLRLKRRPSLFGRTDSPMVENQPQRYRTIPEEAHQWGQPSLTFQQEALKSLQEAAAPDFVLGERRRLKCPVQQQQQQLLLDLAIIPHKGPARTAPSHFAFLLFVPIHEAAEVLAAAFCLKRNICEKSLSKMASSSSAPLLLLLRVLLRGDVCSAGPQDTELASPSSPNLIRTKNEGRRRAAPRRMPDLVRRKNEAHLGTDGCRGRRVPRRDRGGRGAGAASPGRGILLRSVQGRARNRTILVVRMSISR
ncbi:phospholipid-transporting ATPase ID-like [Anableps anableps]